MNKTYTEPEVIELLVNNMNKVMQLIDNKYYTIDYEKKEVYCYRRNIVFKDQLLSTYTFQYIIDEAKKS